MTDEQLRARAGEIERWVIELRRALHQIPEPGFREFQTQKRIMNALDELGIPYETDRTWVVATIRGAHPGRTVALRADMDALPVLEPEGACEFASKNRGYMHACGHDAHVAVQLGAARVLSDARHELHGNVKLLFQPDEEGEGGAEPMCAAGVLKNPDVDEIYGLHMMPTLSVGQMETRHGALNASTDALHIRIIGRSGHAAYPDNGADAIVAAAQVISALQTAVSRNVTPLKSAVVSVCTIKGGLAGNILCGEVEMEGTIRAAFPDIRWLLHSRVSEIAKLTARALGCEAEVDIRLGYPALINTDECVNRIFAVSQRLLGDAGTLVKDAPNMGGEDFSHFLQHCKGAFYHIGCSSPDQTARAPLHSERFFIDEGCLKLAVMMQAGLALDALS